MGDEYEFGRSTNKSELPVMTLDQLARYDFFNRIFDQVKGLDGDVVECGVGWGRSLLHILTVLHLAGDTRNIWAFDSFEGFPEPSIYDQSPRNPKKGEWNSNVGDVQKLLSTFGFSQFIIDKRIIFVKGFFSETLPSYVGKPIVLLHADADLYDSYFDIFNNLYDRVVPGGIIILDEYMNSQENYKFPGAARAVNEFFSGKEMVRRDPIYGKFYIVKGGLN